jgi:Flp pilus assembly protein CpaB
VTPLALPDVRRALSRYRTLLAAGLAAGAMAAALGVLAPKAEAGIRVVTAARDLPAGTALASGDLRTTEVPEALVPAGALRATSPVVGRLLASPLRRGEPVTDVRLAGADLVPPQSTGLVAVPVRVADAASAALVAAGDHVDVLAADAARGGAPDAQVVAVDAEILAVPTAVQDGDGALVVVAATPATARRLAAAAVSSRLSLTLRPRR